jgi:hypothetical protein
MNLGFALSQDPDVQEYLTDIVKEDLSNKKENEHG